MQSLLLILSHPHLVHGIVVLPFFAPVSCLLKQTVNDLLLTTFKKYKTMMSKDLDSNGTGRYVFKVCGYLDYLIHNDFKIGSFDHILFCQRKGMKIELELVKLR